MAELTCYIMVLATSGYHSPHPVVGSVNISPAFCIHQELHVQMCSQVFHRAKRDKVQDVKDTSALGGY